MVKSFSFFVRYCILSFTLAFGFSLHAEIEFPPELKTQEAVRKFAVRIRNLIPEVNTASGAIEPPHHPGGVETYVDMEQQLLNQLKNDPEYMRLAKERPALQTFSFKQVAKEESRGLGVTAQWATFLKDNEFHGKAKTQEEYLAQLEERLKHWPSSSLSGFFSAWAGLLDKEDRAILRIKDVEERWSQLKSRMKDKDLAEIQQKFKAVNFGAQSNSWTWQDLDKIVSDMIALENQIAVLIQNLDPERSAQGEAWFNGEELAEWFDVPEVDNRIAKLLTGLKNRLADTYGDPNAKRVHEVTRRELILRELPPYLAIYRGCIGGDCSTTHSWAFPYAPTERNWWIETSDGKRVGYVSGAITKVGKVTALYLRDITGPTLTPEDVTLVMDGFYAAKAKFGAEVFTLMTAQFTGENHFPVLQKALENYRAGKTRNVIQSFDDVQIRTRYLGRQPKSGLDYDNPKLHETVRQVILTEKDLSHIRVKSISGKVVTRDPNKHADVLWEMLQNAVNTDSTSALEAMFERKVDWQDIIRLIRNDHGARVHDFYAEVERRFAADKLPFSKNMMRKNELLFMTGHLAAPDAFQGDNVRQSVRYVMDMIWRGKGEEREISVLVSKHLRILEENELFGRAVKGLFERRQNDDIRRIELLFGAGFRFKDIELTHDELQWATSSQGSPEITRWATDKMLNHKSWDTLTAADVTPALSEAMARLLNNEDSEVDENISLEAAKLFYRIPEMIQSSQTALHEVKTSIQQDEDPRIRVPLAIAFLKVTDPRDDWFAEVVAILAKDLKGTSLTREWRKEAGELVKKHAPKNTDKNCESALRKDREPISRHSRG